jgi:Kef-type K+ transport system membrane component KefB
VAPFLLGAATALWLHPRYGTRGVSFLVFSLFLGVSLSVTAFPVLARILTDRGLHRTALGATALACAAVADVTAWVMLAFVAGVARADLSGPARLLPWALAYLVVMLVGVRPLVRRVSDAVERTGAPAGRGALSAAFVGLLLSAAATEALGVHALFGAFLFGALLPRDGRLATDLRRALEDLVVVLFLPAFFAVTGLRTRIGLVAGWSDAFVCGLIVAVATVGKFGGTLAAAKLTGHGWRDSVALGTLMNTRGLMELIVLNVGLDLGVIEPRLFAMLVIMALVTTFATSPVLSLLLGRGEATNEPLQAPATARP